MIRNLRKMSVPIVAKLKGHWKKDCPLLQNKDKKDSNANVAHDSNEDFDFAFVRVF